MDHFSGTDPAHPLRRMTAEVAAALKDAADVEPVFMDASDKAAVLVELTTLQDQLHLIELAVARTCGDLAAADGHRDVASWRAATEKRDGRTTRREDRLAEALAERWTAVAAAVAEGRVSLEQATVVVRALDTLADALEAE